MTSLYIKYLDLYDRKDCMALTDGLVFFLPITKLICFILSLVFYVNWIAAVIIPDFIICLSICIFMVIYCRLAGRCYQEESDSHIKTNANVHLVVVLIQLISFIVSMILLFTKPKINEYLSMALILNIVFSSSAVAIGFIQVLCRCGS